MATTTSASASSSGFNASFSVLSQQQPQVPEADRPYLSCSLNFAEDLGDLPKIVRSPPAPRQPHGGDEKKGSEHEEGGEGSVGHVSHSNLFYRDAYVPGRGSGVGSGVGGSETSLGGGSGGGGGGPSLATAGGGGLRASAPQPPSPSPQSSLTDPSPNLPPPPPPTMSPPLSPPLPQRHRSTPGPPRLPPTDRLTQALLSHRDDEKHGAWTFDVDTERDLLQHVENGLAISSSDSPSCARAILRSIDVYCLGKRWMYHVGAEKGGVVADFLNRAVDAAVAKMEMTQPETPLPQSPPRKPRFVCAELGTYCGYSAVLLAATIKERVPPGLDFRVYSTEIDADHLEVARRIVSLSGLDDHVSLIQFDPSKSRLSDALRERIAADEEDSAAAADESASASSVDFLFLDHAKNLYLSDLKELESSGLVGKGTYVAADNVVVSKELAEYRRYVGELAEGGVVETEMIEGKLEYTENLKDGIEFTVYLKDPPSRSSS